jgi:hypothetical protein
MGVLVVPCAFQFPGGLKTTRNKTGNKTQNPAPTLKKKGDRPTSHGILKAQGAPWMDGV